VIERLDKRRCTIERTAADPQPFGIVLMWRRLNASIEARPAWQEALIVGVTVAITLTGVFFAGGHHVGAAAGLGVACGAGSAIGALIGRPLRARRRARHRTGL